MQSLSKYNKASKYLLYEIHLFSKYMGIVPLKNKRRITIVNVFQKIISKGRQPVKDGLMKVVSFTTSFLRDF